MKKRYFICIVFFCLLISASLLQAQTEWIAGLEIRSEGLRYTLYFGVNPNASDDYDNGLDHISPPPGFGPYAYFAISSFPNYLSTDIRKSNHHISWQLRTVNLEGDSLKLKWNLEEIDSTIVDSTRLHIGEMNMFKTDSVTLIGDLSVDIQWSVTTDVQTKNRSNFNPKDYRIDTFPNPFNPETTIQFDLPEARQVKLLIYNIRGQLVRTILDKPLHAGSHNLVWDGRDGYGQTVPSGTYFCRISAGGFRAVKKLILIR